MRARHEPPDDAVLGLLPGIEEAIRADARGWRALRAWPTGRRIAAAAALLSLLNLLVVLGSPRTDLDALPVGRLIAAVAALLVSGLAAAVLFLRPLQRRALDPRATGAAALLLTILPLAFALVSPGHDELAAHPESFVGVGADFVPRALACLLFGTLVGAPVAGFLLVVDRQPQASAGRLLLAAGAGGAAGTLGLLLHCPLESVAHRLTGHGAVALSVPVLLAAVHAVLRARGRSGGTA